MLKLYNYINEFIELSNEFIDSRKKAKSEYMKYLLNEDNYLEFKSFKSAKKWGEKNYKSWLISDQEEEGAFHCWWKYSKVGKALKYYCGFEYIQINSILRGRDMCKYDKQYIDRANLIINELNTFSLPENIIVYRCISHEYLKNITKNKVFLGCILEEKAFVSTTLNINSYINESNRDDFDIILKILVPKSSKGAYVGLISHLKRELEFLFPPNQKLIYIRKESRIKGKKVLLCKLLL